MGKKRIFPLYLGKKISFLERGGGEKNIILWANIHPRNRCNGFLLDTFSNKCRGGGYKNLWNNNHLCLRRKGFGSLEMPSNGYKRTILEYLGRHTK